MKGSRIEILPNAGHIVMMEAPQTFNEKVGEFIIGESKGLNEPGVQAVG